mmetsp:Transcript_24748/g.27414  ORF Transcript_24748/g.27414 Transcript_24748/m.27414 type:complete len:131 (+) Transcript_24748:358-750(+)
MRESGIDRSGILIFESDSSQYCGREIQSIFVPKGDIIDNLLDFDVIDQGDTVIEEISLMSSSSGSQSGNSLKEYQSDSEDSELDIPEEEVPVKSWSDIKFNGHKISMYETQLLLPEGDEGYISSSSSEDD